MPTTITWDETGSRYYESGISKGVLFVQNADGTYKTGVPWNGLTKIDENPDGAEATDLWADNIKYATMRSAEKFGGTIEAYTYPDEWAECDGFADAGISGVMVSGQGRSSFGLCYRTEVGSDTSTEAGYQLHIVWNATASPADRSYETINDSPSAITMSWEFETTPVNINSSFKPTSRIIIDSTRLETEDLAKLTALEETLYSGTLPTPLAVLTAMGYTA